MTGQVNEGSPKGLLDNEWQANIQVLFLSQRIERERDLHRRRQWSAGMPKASMRSRRYRRALIHLASPTDCLALEWRQGNAR